MKALAVVLGVLALACGDDGEVSPRGLPGPTPEGTSPGTKLPTTRGERAPNGLPRGLRPPSGGPVPAAEEEDASERDYAAELRALAGDPSRCGSLGPATGSITIRVGAVATSQGVVTRASASGPVSAEVLRCLEERIGRGRFRPPVERAPRHVSAELRLRPNEPPTTTVAEEVVPDWEPPGEPGVPIEGPAGVPISGDPGQPIQGPAGEPIQAEPGEPIDAVPGRPIQGPEGVPIGSDD